MNFINYLKDKKISVRDVSTSCDIPYATLHNNIEKPNTMKAGNLKKISNFLGLSMEDVFVMLMDRGGGSLLQILLD